LKTFIIVQFEISAWFFRLVITGKYFDCGHPVILVFAHTET